MPYSKVEKLSDSQQQKHVEFTQYLTKVVGLKAPGHVTESLERRAQIFIREKIKSDFTCVYDTDDIRFLEKAVSAIKLDEDWNHYNKRNAGTIINSINHYIRFLMHHRGVKAEYTPVVNPDTYKEGRISYRHSIGYERDAKARMACLQHYGYRCAICGFNFEETYGGIGRDFIEVHHIVPVHERGGEYKVDPIKDLIPLCSNCHSMIHRRNPVYSPEELMKMLHKH